MWELQPAAKTGEEKKKAASLAVSHAQELKIATPIATEPTNA